MHQETQFHEMNRTIKPLQILICCHENASFSFVPVEKWIYHRKEQNNRWELQ